MGAWIPVCGAPHAVESAHAHVFQVRAVGGPAGAASLSMLRTSSPAPGAEYEPPQPPMPPTTSPLPRHTSGTPGLPHARNRNPSLCLVKPALSHGNTCGLRADLRGSAGA